MARRNIMRDAYYCGVIDFVHGVPQDTGEWCMGTPREIEQAHAQGYRDAKARRVLRPQTYKDETVRFRVEVHEAAEEPS